jgi:hypothetical protein
VIRFEVAAAAGLSPRDLEDLVAAAVARAVTELPGR